MLFGIPLHPTQYTCVGRLVKKVRTDGSINASNPCFLSRSQVSAQILHFSFLFLTINEYSECKICMGPSKIFTGVNKVLFNSVNKICLACLATSSESPVLRLVSRI